ncbi:hypothetical protein [Agaribacterium haliotis]|uniref:hypothetical protein n=1 Tax=Agaribacterium haliotis TaxID=2013869 RepID=UPI001177B7CD|nr:hypothetical protein [Agaribacterium haliotis]
MRMSLVLVLPLLLALYACGGGGSSSSQNNESLDLTPEIPVLLSPEKEIIPGGEQTQTFIVNGVDSPVSISIDGAEYAIDGGGFTSEPGMVGNGQSVSVKMFAPDAYGEKATAVVTVGRSEVLVQVVSEEEDLTPDEVVFKDINSASIGQEFESEAHIISGINNSIPITVSGALYSIDGAPFTGEPSMISAGQAVLMKMMSGDSFQEKVTAELTVGSVIMTWNIVTEAEDKTPNVFSFDVVTDAMRESEHVTQPLQITGINTATDISISGGEYSIDGSDFTADLGSINDGQHVSVRLIASSEFSTNSVAKLTVGETSADFVVTTEDLDITPDETSFISLTDLARDQLVESNLITINGVNSLVPVSIAGGEYSIDGGEYTKEPGHVAEAQTIKLRASASSDWEGIHEVVLTSNTTSTSWILTTMVENIPPEAEIIFPISGTSTSAEELRVRGIATDNTDIASVNVNGVTAELTTLSVNETGVVVEWVADISSSAEHGLISIDVEDTKGNSALDADSVTIHKNYRLPWYLSHVERGVAIFGRHVWDAERADIINGQMQSFRLSTDGIGQGCYSQKNNSYFYLETNDSVAADADWAGDDHIDLVVKAYNFDTGLISSYSEFMASSYPGPEQISYKVIELECADELDAVYAFTSLIKSGYENYYSQISKIGTSSSASAEVVLSSSDEGFAEWELENATISGTSLVTISSVIDPEVSIFNLNTMELTNSYSLTLSTVRDLAFDNDNKVFFVTDSSTYQLLVGSGGFSSLSVVDANDDNAFHSVSSMVIGDDDQLYVRDVSKDALFEVDPATGDRSLYLAPSQVGQGDALVAGQSMVIDKDYQKAYVLDRVAWQKILLVQVDLNTGDRELLEEIGTVEAVENLALEISGDDETLYLSIESAVYSYDIATQALAIVASSSYGTGFEFNAVSSLDLNEDETLLLASDPELGAVFSIDLESGLRALISQNGAVGDGPDMLSINGVVALDNIYALVSDSDLVVSIDKNTGDRTVISPSACPHWSVGNLGVDLEGHYFNGLRHSAIDNKLMVSGNFSSISIGLEDNQCTFYTFTSSRDIYAYGNDTYFTLAFDAIQYVDFKTAGVVDVSR